MKIDLEAFRQHEKDKLVTCRSHVNGGLLIWNYTPRAQFERIWDDVTTQARGLITDLEGNIKARPFKKFFNYGEYEGEEPSLIGAKITDKYDGSLGILYTDGFDWAIATRGSFESEQAIKGTELLHLHIFKHGTNWIDPDITYLFEIIYPQNRIVVDYEGEETLILLAAFETETGKEIDIAHVEFPNKAQEWVDFKDMKELFDLEKDNSEGLVVRFADGLRLKVKWEEYVRLHKLVTGVNAKWIWECLSTGTSLDPILDRVPDEFFAWVNNKKAELEYLFREFRSAGQYQFDLVKYLPSRKEQALALKEAAPTIRSVAFALLDNKPEDQIAQRIWKAIKPVYETPYRTDIDS